MTPARQQFALVAVMLLLLAGVLVWAAGAWAAARDRAERAAGQLQRARQLSAEIVALRGRPVGVGGEPTDAEFAFLIEGSLVAAGLDPGVVLQSISPEPPRAAPGGLRERRTQLRLQGVTRRELATFLHTLLSRQPALHVGTLQLTSPRPGPAPGTGPAGETWTVDPLAVSYYTSGDPDHAARGVEE